MSEIFQYFEADPDSLQPTWRPMRTHSLRWTPGWDLPALLDEWEPRLTDLDDPDTAACVTLPSHATADVPALIRHGFAPLVAVAERPAGRAHLRRPSDVTVRPAVSSDLDVAVELNMNTVRFDAQFGMITERPDTEDHLRSSISQMLSRDHDCLWLAERDGTPVGMISVNFPPHADWVHGYTEVRPIAYIDHLGVRPEARGGGAGSALVAFAHDVIDEAGVKSTLLHHALPNPRSTPFWYSHGYQPRWMIWVRRPGMPSRVSSGVSP